jgi:uncharacterized protein
MGSFPIPLGKTGGGLGILVVLVYLGIQLLGGGSGGLNIGPAFGTGLEAPGEPTAVGIPPAEDPERDLKDFSTYVFSDAQQTWEGTFRRASEPYTRSQMVLFRECVNTGCGAASSAIGPFYCPADGRVYLDLSFYDDMQNSLGAPGDFAWAYVIAHEMGHHVQDETGTSDQVHSQQQSSPADANDLSVRLELQADCYAGVWANTVFKQGDLENGDVREAVQASAAVGDDRLQRRAGGSINPDSFTHGTSAQRSKWFQMGFREGDPGACDTFSVISPDAPVRDGLPRS